MKVVHINTSNKGGAGIAALRLHEELMKLGVDSKFLSLYQFPSTVKEQYLFRKRDTSKIPLLTDASTFFFKVLRKLNLYTPVPKNYEKKYLKGRAEGFELFSFPFSDLDLLQHPLVKSADVIHLHWVNDGFLDFQSFFERCDKKIVWTLHDMNPITGGCHHSDGCLKFTVDCHSCPQLLGTIDDNYAEKMLAIKNKAIQHIQQTQLKVVAPSDWLKKLSQQSLLFKRFAHYTIPNVLNDSIFQIRNKRDARKKWNIPADKKVILIVAHDLSNMRKGARFLIEALNRFGKDEHVLVCSIGSGADAMSLNLEHKKMGYVNDEAVMAELYACADVFVLPSMAENFPNTICESLLCGTPVVAFKVGGIPELVSDENGRTVEPFDIEQFYSAIHFVINNAIQFDRDSIGKNAFEKLNKIDSTKQYLALYSELTNNA